MASNLAPECPKLINKNPYQFNGPTQAYETKKVKDGDLKVRVDMPGVEKEDVNIWVEDTTVFFHGQGRKLWDQEPTPPRNYFGSITLYRPDTCRKIDIGEIKSEMKNGVLLMLIPSTTVVATNYPSSSSTHLSPFTNPFPNVTVTINPDREYRLTAGHLITFRKSPLFQQPDSNYGLYPFQVSGSVETLEAGVIDDENLYVRVDMPGVPVEKFCSKVIGNSVGFGGDSLKESDDDDEDQQRKYFGNIDFQCGCCNITNVKFEIKAGVLRMLVSKKKIN